VSTLLLVVRLGLAAMFAVAGAAKLADRDGSREAVRGFGVPDALAGPLGIALPLAELATTALLVPAATARAGAAAAIVLLLAFCAAIGRALARDEAPDCHCFGALHSAPAGWPALARNGALAALAVPVAAATPRSATGWLQAMTGAERTAVLVAIAALLVAAACAWLAWQLLRAHGRLLRRIDALEAGGAVPAAPGFSLEGLDGRTHTLERLRASGRPVLLLFTDPGCGPCRALMPAVAGWQRALAGSLTVAVVSSGDAAEVRAEAELHGLGTVLLSPDRAVSHAFGAHGTPAAVLIGPDGRRRGEVAGGRDAIEALVASIVPAPLALVERPARPRLPTPGPAVGDPVPEIELPTLEGGRFALTGRRTLLVSWNPGCGFCRKMAAPLREALAAAGSEVPDVVLLARGTPEANRELDPPATVALDADGSVAAALGASGTPIAVLVDEDGRIAAGPAVGATAALALLAAEPAPVR
jgi:thiol-disulfide isomerase/thioredoxin